MKTETERYQELTEFQRNVVDSLKALGFTWKYFYTYECSNWGVINVKKFDSWSKVLKYVHNQGKERQRHEFQRVLGI